MLTASRRLSVSILIALVLIQIIFTSTGASGGSENTSFYGFIIDVNSDQSYSMQNNITKLINKLTRNDVPVYWLASDKSIRSQELNEEKETFSKTYQKGSFIVLFDSGSSVNKKAASYVYMSRLNNKCKVNKIMEKIDEIQVYKLVKLRIAYLDVTNSNYTNYAPHSLRVGGFPEADLLDWDEIPDKLNNEDYNLFICGGGSWDDLKESGATIFEINRAVNKISKFIKNGGNYVGTCFGGYLASSGIILPINLLHSYFPNLPLLNIGFIGCDYTTMNALPGGGIVKIKATEPDHPVFYGVNEITYQYLAPGGAVYNWCGRNTKKLAILEDISEGNFDWWDGDGEEDRYNIPPLLREIWTKYSLNRAVAAISTLGEGRVITFGCHPEFGSSWDEQDSVWGSSYRLYHNSLFFSTANEQIDLDIVNSDSFNLLEVKAGGPYYGVEDNEINFSGSVTNGTAPYNWHWEFEAPYWHYRHSDDDYISNEKNPTFTYESDGIYQITLLVTDANGDFGYDITQVQVLTHYKNLEVEINVPFSANIEEKIQFNCKVDYGLPPYQYHWDFGDGINSSEKNPIYLYNKPGEYECTLEVKDQMGYSKISKRSIRISPLDKEHITSSDAPAVHVILPILAVVIIISLLVIFILRKRTNKL